jgi:hypothetical protein
MCVCYFKLLIKLYLHKIKEKKIFILRFSSFFLIFTVFFEFKKKKLKSKENKRV